MGSNKSELVRISTSNLIMLNFNYLLGGALIGITATLLTLELQKPKPLAEDFARDYIGVYTQYDMYWINPDKHNIVSENGQLDTTFTSRKEMSDFLEFYSAMQCRMAEALPFESWIYMQYENDSMAVVKDLPKGRLLIEKDGKYRHIVDTIGWVVPTDDARYSNWGYRIDIIKK